VRAPVDRTDRVVWAVTLGHLRLRCDRQDHWNGALTDPLWGASELADSMTSSCISAQHASRHWTDWPLP
jgi:hypothetical protein